MPIQLVVAGVALILLIALTLTRLILWFLIARNPSAYMLHIEESRAIARPPEAAFAFLADLGNDTILSPRVTAVELTSPEPLGVGTTYRETIRVGPTTQSISCVVTDYEFPHHLGLSCQYTGRTLLGGYRVAPHDAGCVVTTLSEFTHTTASLLFAPLTKSMIRRECRAALHRLQIALESSR